MMTILNIQNKYRLFSEIISYLFKINNYVLTFQVCKRFSGNIQSENKYIQFIFSLLLNTSGYFYKLACYVWEVITLIERGFPLRTKTTKKKPLNKLANTVGYV